MGAAAVIVAAGRGTRAGGAVPKQWQMLAGRAVLAWTLDAFRSSPDIGDIVLVLHPGDMGLAPGYANHPDVDVVPGGATRAASVRAGLEALDGTGATRVLIHDAARPLISHALIARVVAALDHSAGAAPALEVTDSLWRGDGGIVSGTLSRAGLWRAQTPQGFRFDAILAAHRNHAGHPGGDAATDDVAVARASGLDVAIVPGDERNLKITGPDDFARAERLMGDGMDIRVGNGFDVHRFTEGDAVVLCGVRVPHGRGLDGHSDADVGMHALTDAIYGALADGDIGRHFPPSDAEWKGADSAIFLEHAMARARARGYDLANADVTLVCERPKIAPYAEAMRLRLAEILEVDPGRVSVKATTSERLGFTGREEGIAAQATATLIAR
jgi:2-C-methyl-D-erythritol 4-phosphate cytidylyltransferase / 2-C-methyl-D-erythritol 2,4-cyclodiphosphate synthase